MRNAFVSNMSSDKKLNKAKLSKIIQSGEYLGALLGKYADPLIKVASPLAKNVAVPLGNLA